MSYPNVIYGDYGDEKVTAASAIGGLPLGQLMILPDGRKFRHAQCGSAAAVSAGDVVSPSAGSAGHGAVSASGISAAATTTYNAIGDTVVHLVCNSATSVLANHYADGLLNVQKSAGIGHVYRIKENTSCASASAFSVTLDPDDPLEVAFAATSTKVSLRRSPYKEAVLMSGSACIAPPMGVAPVAVTASHYFWVQRGGPCSIKTSGTTVTVGSPFCACTAADGKITAGAAASAATNVWDTVPLGFALEVCTAADAVIGDLRLE